MYSKTEIMKSSKLGVRPAVKSKPARKSDKVSKAFGAVDDATTVEYPDEFQTRYGVFRFSHSRRDSDGEVMVYKGGVTDDGSLAVDSDDFNEYYGPIAVMFRAASYNPDGSGRYYRDVQCRTDYRRDVASNLENAGGDSALVKIVEEFVDKAADILERRM